MSNTKDSLEKRVALMEKAAGAMKIFSEVERGTFASLAIFETAKHLHQQYQAGWTADSSGHLWGAGFGITMAGLVSAGIYLVRYLDRKEAEIKNPATASSGDLYPTNN